MVTLGLYFECGDVFVSAYIEKLNSWEEAEQNLIEPPSLIVANDWICIRSRTRGDKMICADEDTSDHVGCWKEGHDRRSHDDYIDGLLSVPTILPLLDSASLFSLRWFFITEYGRDKNGYSSIIRTISKNIDRPEKRGRCSEKG